MIGKLQTKRMSKNSKRQRGLQPQSPTLLILDLLFGYLVDLPRDVFDNDLQWLRDFISVFGAHIRILRKSNVI